MTLQSPPSSAPVCRARNPNYLSLTLTVTLLLFIVSSDPHLRLEMRTAGSPIAAM